MKRVVVIEQKFAEQYGFEEVDEVEVGSDIDESMKEAKDLASEYVVAHPTIPGPFESGGASRR